MASTADIKKGLCIRFNHDIYKIIEFLHVKPGKGPAFVRTKLKSVTTGKTIDNTFSAGHKIDDVRVETRSFQYLYPEGEELVFMNVEDFNQVHIRRDMLDYPDLLKEGEVVMIIFNAEDENDLEQLAQLDKAVIEQLNQAIMDGEPKNSPAEESSK